MRNSTKTTSIANKGRRKLEYNRAVFSPGDSVGGNFCSRLCFVKTYELRLLGGGAPFGQAFVSGLSEMIGNEVSSSQIFLLCFRAYFFEPRTY